ncbi:hypothetical protein NQZ79_g563 [Umbelopsis isabellina]|nr:hypothetical protein NQZ79_g563 [Umbelopsis isabellina]
MTPDALHHEPSKSEERIEYASFTKAQERALVRKYDLRLLPFLSFMYLFSSLDRSSVGVLAFGILQMRGIGGLAGWQWLFLIEGIPTVLVSIVAFFYLPADPSKCSWLTEDEKVLAEERLQLEGSGGHQSLGDLSASNRQEAFAALKDWKVWLYMIIFFCGSVPNTSISNFLPTIISGMGYSNKLDANLMSAPPYVCAVAVVILVAHSSDRFSDRAYHAIGGAVVCLVGYILLVSITGNSARYGAVCLSVAGVFVINPIVNAWLTGNIAPGMKKSVATAMAVSANNAAGLVGSNIYLKSDAPNYSKLNSVPRPYSQLGIHGLIHRAGSASAIPAVAREQESPKATFRLGGQKGG